MQIKHLPRLLALLFLIWPIVAPAENDEDLAKKLANPVASLISVPIQANYDENFGPDGKGEMWRINIQPVIPVSLNDDWNLITRTILPIVSQKNIPFSGTDKSGLGDTVQSFFFSPKKPTAGGLIWGVGPVVYLPTATDKKTGCREIGCRSNRRGAQTARPLDLWFADQSYTIVCR